MKSSIKLAYVWAFALAAIGVGFACGLSPSPSEGVALLGFGGLIVSNATLTALAQGFNAAFRRGFEGVASTYQQVAMVVPKNRLGGRPTTHFQDQSASHALCLPGDRLSRRWTQMIAQVCDALRSALPSQLAAKLTNERRLQCIQETRTSAN